MRQIFSIDIAHVQWRRKGVQRKWNGGLYFVIIHYKTTSFMSEVGFPYCNLSKHSNCTILFPRITYYDKNKNKNGKIHKICLSALTLTTMPILLLSVEETSSTVSSNVIFMNWSKPRKTPCTVRFPFNFKFNVLSMYRLRSGPVTFPMLFAMQFYQLEMDGRSSGDA